MPWNFPSGKCSLRRAALVGECRDLKHAPNVPRCALEIESVFRMRDCGRPVPGGVPLECAAGGVIADARVRAVTLTGSDRRGARWQSRRGGT